MLKTRPINRPCLPGAPRRGCQQFMSSSINDIFTSSYIWKKHIYTDLFKPPEMHPLIQIGPLRKEQPMYKYEQQITACTSKSANGQSAITTLGFKCAVIYSHCGKGGEAEELRRGSKSTETCPSEAAEAKPVTFKSGFCQICSANWGKA